MAQRPGVDRRRERCSDPEGLRDAADAPARRRHAARQRVLRPLRAEPRGADGQRAGGAGRYDAPQAEDSDRGADEHPGARALRPRAARPARAELGPLRERRRGRRAPVRARAQGQAGLDRRGPRRELRHLAPATRRPGRGSRRRRDGRGVARGGRHALEPQRRRRRGAAACVGAAPTHRFRAAARRRGLHARPQGLRRQCDRYIGGARGARLARRCVTRRRSGLPAKEAGRASPDVADALAEASRERRAAGMRRRGRPPGGIRGYPAVRVRARHVPPPQGTSHVRPARVS